MGSQVFYRKWRPQTLAEVTGQDQVTQILHNALETRRVAHAYLFCGPRGTGKTSTGRILAKAVNCLRSGTEEPCNTCNMCQAISQGRALDIIEIDAASNRGIDEIRELRERINFSPATARYKVYIVDEVHMLTDAASNALLKTLEEPPPHAILILCTTEPHKLLPTIISRCQRLDFRRLSPTAIASKLSYVCQKEGISLEPAAFRVIARSASGSLRDAENILEQLLAYYGPQISLKQVQEMLGLTPERRVEELVRHITQKDLKNSLATINSIVSDGVDLVQFHRQLMEYLRRTLLLNSGAEDTLDLTSEERAEMKKVAAQLSLSEWLKVTRLLGQVDFRSHDYSPLPLELALAECTLLPGEKAPPSTSPTVRNATASYAPAPQRAKESLTNVAASPSLRREQPAAKPDKVEKVKETGSVTAENIAPPVEKSSQKTTWERHPSFDYIQRHWHEFVDSFRGMGSNGDLDARLRSGCEPVEIKEDTLVLAFRWPVHYEKVNDRKYLHLVEKKLEELFGTPNKVQCILRPKASQSARNSVQVKVLQGMGGKIVNVEEK